MLLLRYLLLGFWLSLSWPVEVAEKYLHIRERDNIYFNDSTFWEKLKERGWRKGQNWCAYFTWIVLDESKNTLKVRSPLAQRYIVSQSIPAKRALEGQKIPKHSLVIWKRGNTIFGHIGLVVQQKDKRTFETIEGNAPNGVYRKVRKIEPLNQFRITHFTLIQ